MMYPKSDEDYMLIIFAMRYTLGRQSYAVGVVTDYLLKIADCVDPKFKEAVIKEVKEAIENGRAGDEMIDVPLWKKVLLTYSLSEEKV